MSALDQQVAEALSAYDKAQRDAGGEIADSGNLYYDQEIAIATTRDALLTTHRRQVLTEIEEKLLAETDKLVGNKEVSVGEIVGIQAAASFVASLRDTKETV